MSLLTGSRAIFLRVCNNDTEVEAVLRGRDWLMIPKRIAQEVYVKDVAAELGVHPRSISPALGRGGAAPGSILALPITLQRPKPRQ
jgi:hypothetical protein